MFKKILGIVLIIVAIIIITGFLIGTPKTMNILLSGISFYAFGYFIGQILFLTLGIILLIIGIKWVKGKKVVDNQFENFNK